MLSLALSSAGPALRRPLMSAGLKPWVTRGATDRTAAWDRLAATSSQLAKRKADHAR